MHENIHRYPNGTRFGEYETLEFLASGGFGTVYKAQSIHHRSLCALKLISKSSEAADAEKLGAQLQGAFAAKHRMVPRVFDVDYAERDLYIAMEYVPDPSLDDELRRARRQHRTFEPGRAVRNVTLMCEFLKRAHSFESDIGDGKRRKEIIHGDLKPAHVFLSQAGIMVLDFGLATGLDSNRDVKTMRAMTAFYASPQRFLSNKGSKLDDLWAVGVMFYEMIAGHRPLSRFEEDPEQFRRALEGGAEFPRLPSTCARQIADIVDRLLRREPPERYQSAVDVLDALKKYRPEPELGEDPRPTRKRDRRAQASQQPASDAVVPPDRTTRPRPPDVARSDKRASNKAPTLPAESYPVRLRWSYRPLWVVLVVTAGMVLTSEAVASLTAERMRSDLASLDAPSITAWRRTYDRMETWTLLNAGARFRLDALLRERLVAVAGGIIADYRQDDPSVASGQWQQACDGLVWATRLGSYDRNIDARQQLCGGHLERIKAQEIARTDADESRLLYMRAVSQFERAAALDDTSPDPYLGLSRIYIYGFRDVDRGSNAIARAEALGHPRGWRESAQLGDGFWGRAREENQRAMKLPPSARRDTYDRLREAATRCVEFYKPILHRGNAKVNSNQCQQWLKAATRPVGGLPTTQGP